MHLKFKAFWYIPSERSVFMGTTIKTKPRQNIIELFADYDGEYTPTTIDWGEPTGAEIITVKNQEKNNDYEMLSL